MKQQICSCCKKPLNKEEMSFIGLQEDAEGIFRWEMWNCSCKSTVLIPIEGAIVISFETKKAMLKKVASLIFILFVSGCGKEFSTAPFCGESVCSSTQNCYQMCDDQNPGNAIGRESCFAVQVDRLVCEESYYKAIEHIEAESELN